MGRHLTRSAQRRAVPPGEPLTQCQPDSVDAARVATANWGLRFVFCPTFVKKFLQPEFDLQKTIANAVHERSFKTTIDGISTIHQLNEIFAPLDPLRDILAETLKG